LAYTLFFFDPAVTRRDARTVYELVAVQGRPRTAGKSRRVLAFVEKAFQQLPNLEHFEYEDSTDPTLSGNFFMIHLPMSHDEVMVTRLLQIAESHGVTAYDPQMDAGAAAAGS
jgi:hypothetical protein